MPRMSVVRLFCPSLVVGEQALSADESHHLIGVLRAKPGRSLVLFDGAGTQALATLLRVERRTAIVEVEAPAHRDFALDHRVTLGVAVGKQTRHAYMIEKCTELGVRSVWPLIAERSVTHPGAAAIDKWRRRAIEAVRQSGRAWVPDIHLAQTFEEVVARASGFAAAGYCDVTLAGRSIRTFFDTTKPPCDVLLLVGPEGGWSDRERNEAREKGLDPVSLGPTTLRTETAAVAVCASAAAACGFSGNAQNNEQARRM